MDLQNAIVDFWKSNRYCASVDQLASLNLPHSCNEFFMHVGIPIKLTAASQSLGMELGPASGVSFLSCYDGPLASNKPNSQLFYLGVSFESYICIRELDGEILLVDDEAITFLNSGLEQFVAFLWVYERSTGKGRGMDAEQFARMVEVIKGELKSIDPRVFLDPENWWMVVLEEFRY